MVDTPTITSPKRMKCHEGAVAKTRKIKALAKLMLTIRNLLPYLSAMYPPANWKNAIATLETETIAPIKNAEAPKAST